MTGYVMHAKRAAMTWMARQQTQYARDRQVCRCGHFCVSHGCDDVVGVFQGIGGGTCGVADCGCEFFRHDVPRCSPHRPCGVCVLFVPVRAPRADAGMTERVVPGTTHVEVLR